MGRTIDKVSLTCNPEWHERHFAQDRIASKKCCTSTLRDFRLPNFDDRTGLLELPVDRPVYNPEKLEGNYADVTEFLGCLTVREVDIHAFNSFANWR